MLTQSAHRSWSHGKQLYRFHPLLVRLRPADGQYELEHRNLKFSTLEGISRRGNMLHCEQFS